MKISNKENGDVVLTLTDDEANLVYRSLEMQKTTLDEMIPREAGKLLDIITKWRDSWK